MIKGHSQTFYCNIGVLRHFVQMGLKKRGVKMQTENMFRKHLEPTKHAHNVSKQIRPEMIRTKHPTHLTLHMEVGADYFF